jgi:hypothetical protein
MVMKQEVEIRDSMLVVKSAAEGAVVKLIARDRAAGQVTR